MSRCDKNRGVMQYIVQTTNKQQLTEWMCVHAYVYTYMYNER